MEVTRFDIWWVALDPVRGSEIRKTRPCVVISPDEFNRHLNTVIIAPMTSVIRNYPSRIKYSFQKINGQIALDQLRTADKSRLKKKLGKMDEAASKLVCELLVTIFEY